VKKTWQRKPQDSQGEPQIPTAGDDNANTEATFGVEQVRGPIGHNENANLKASSSLDQVPAPMEPQKNAEDGASAIPDHVPVGAPIARHENIRSEMPIDHSESTGSSGLDITSLDSAANQPSGAQGAEYDEQPSQHAQLAEEQVLEPEDVRCVPRPLRRRRRRSSSVTLLSTCAAV